MSLIRWSVTLPCGIVVGPHLLRALPRPDLRAAIRRDLFLLLADRMLVEARAQHAHGALTVLQLRLLVLHRDHDPTRLVRDAHGRIGRVDRLTAWARRTIYVDLQVIRVDRDLDLLRFRKHRDSRRRRVDPPLRLGLRDALDAVNAGLVLEHAVGAVALDGERHLLEAAGLRRAQTEVLGLEPAALGVARQHPVEVGREQRGLVPARPGADLDDHVLRVVGVALDHREAKLLGDFLHLRARGRDELLELPAVVRLESVVAGTLEQLLRSCRVAVRLAEALGELVRLAQLPILARQLRVARAVRDRLGVGELLTELAVALLDLIDEALGYRSVGHRRSGDDFHAEAVLVGRGGGVLDCQHGLKRGDRDCELVERGLAGRQLLELKPGPHQAAHPPLARGCAPPT